MRNAIRACVAAVGLVGRPVPHRQADLHRGFAGTKKRLLVVPGSHHFSGHLDALEAALADGLSTLLTR